MIDYNKEAPKYEKKSLYLFQGRVLVSYVVTKQAIIFLVIQEQRKHVI